MRISDCISDVCSSELPRQPSLARRLDLPPVLAQLGRDRGQADLSVDARFLIARAPAPTAEHAIFADLEPARAGDAADRDIVRLAPSEIDQAGADRKSVV